MILVIGDTSENLAKWTIDKFGCGELINDSNFKTLTKSVYFTALGDLNFDQIKSLALIATEVYLADNLPWDDVAALEKTNILCNHISFFKTINGFFITDPDLFLSAPILRKHSEPTLWTFGCSHTAGVGLNLPDSEAYGAVLSKKLRMPWQNIALPGSSTRWSLSQLIQVKFDPNDIVVWATTGPDRIRVAGDVVQEVSLKNASKAGILYYSDNQILFDHLDYLNTGVKYLKVNNTKFILLNLLTNSSYFNRIELEFSRNKEWCPALDWSEHDVGNDGIHIGPIGHTKLAERIYNHVQLLRYDKFI